MNSQKDFKVLLITANTYMTTLVPPTIALLSAYLKNAGFQVKLFDTTFYKTREDESEEVDKQLFCIDCEWDFTYKELKEDLEGCIKKVREDIDKNKNRIRNGKESDYQELRENIKQFMYDAENQKEWRE